MRGRQNGGERRLADNGRQEVGQDGPLIVQADLALGLGEHSRARPIAVLQGQPVDPQIVESPDDGVQRCDESVFVIAGIPDQRLTCRVSR